MHGPWVNREGTNTTLISAWITPDRESTDCGSRLRKVKARSGTFVAKEVQWSGASNNGHHGVKYHRGIFIKPHWVPSVLIFSDELGTTVKDIVLDGRPDPRIAGLTLAFRIMQDLESCLPPRELVP